MHHKYLTLQPSLAIMNDGSLNSCVIFIMYKYTGIEQSFQDKCQMVKKHIDDLKLRIERLEANPG